MTIPDKIQQVSVALDNLAAIPQPVPEYDEEGNPTPAYQDALDQYNADYGTLRDSIIAAGGSDFSVGIALAGYDPATIYQAGLTACLKVTLQILYTLKWAEDIP